MRISAIVKESIVDGPGLRYVVFVQGCPHRCAGCHNPGTHDVAGGTEMSAAALAADLEEALGDNPLLQGVTLSGGEPFLYADELADFAARARKLGLDVWTYTGYTLAELADLDRQGTPGVARLISKTDTLVDGRFEAEERTLEARFVGSRNQRIITNPNIVHFNNATGAEGAYDVLTPGEDTTGRSTTGGDAMIECSKTGVATDESHRATSSEHRATPGDENTKKLRSTRTISKAQRE